MNILILEDEPLVAQDLVNLIKRSGQDITVLAILNSVESSLQWFSKNSPPDLIFSDIQLADGISFSIFEKIQPDCPIIFTTAFDEYAIKAFQLNSVDYLLKPIGDAELKRALDKYYRLHNSMVKVNQKEILEQLLGDLNSGVQKKYKQRFLAHYKSTLVPVPQEKVTYFMKDELIYLVTNDQKSLVTDYHSLEELEELVDPSVFFRANRQYIISIHAVDHLKNHHTGKVMVTLKTPMEEVEITVSREKAAKLKEWFEG